MSKDNGGPAFPRMCMTNDGLSEYEGMTLRDYFAAKAMQGILANSRLDVSSNWEDYAVDAYAMADAMIKEREK